MTDAPGFHPPQTDDRAGRPATPDARPPRAADETAVVGRPAGSGALPSGALPSAASGAAGSMSTALPNADARGSQPLVPPVVAPVAAPVVVPPRGRRRAKLSIASVDPWSVFRFSLVFSVTLLIIWVVVAAVLWQLLNGMNVFQSLIDVLNIIRGRDKVPLTVVEVFNFKHAMVWAAGLGVLNAILFTALGTLGAFIYNLCARIVGGIEVTLADRD